MLDQTIVALELPANHYALNIFVDALRCLVTMNRHPNVVPFLSVSTGSDGRTLNVHLQQLRRPLSEWLGLVQDDQRRRRGADEAVEVGTSGGDGGSGSGSGSGGATTTTTTIKDSDRIAFPSNAMRKRAAHELVAALAFAHHNSIAHRYLTSSIVMVDDDDCVRVGQFYTASSSVSGELSYICPRNYRPPEVIMNLSRNAEGPAPLEQVDAWSVGCLMFEIATSTTLFSLVSSRDGAGTTRAPLVKQQLIDIMAVIGAPSAGECAAMQCNARQEAFLTSNRCTRRLRELVAERKPCDMSDEDAVVWADAIDGCLRFVNSERTTMGELLKHRLFADSADCAAVAVGRVPDDVVRAEVVTLLRRLDINVGDALW